MKEIYDNLYRTADYNEPNITGNSEKWNLILPIIQQISPTNAVDLGCGRGYYLNKMLELKIDSFGVEFSGECCGTHLKNLPHECIDIDSFCSGVKDKYDMALCMDVLEHLDPRAINESIKRISAVSRDAIFGISNHSDIMAGIELHQIQQPADYWKTILSESYGHVEQIRDDGRFMIFHCANTVNILIVHPSRGRPKEAAAAFRNHVGGRGSAGTRITYIFCLDNDDMEVYDTSLSAPGVQVAYLVANNNGCCQAVNRAYSKLLLEKNDFVILTSDDMELCKDWDVVLKERFDRHGYGVCLKTKQPGGRDDILTLQIAGSKFFLDYGTFFWPEYISMYGDQDISEWAKLKNRWIDAPDIICPHLHPSTGLPNSFKRDETYNKEMQNDRFKQGLDVINRRRTEGFPECNNGDKRNMDAVYTIQYSKDNLESAMDRMFNSTRSLNGQDCFKIVINSSNQCILKQVKGLSDTILYIFRPCSTPGWKSKILNHVVKYWVITKYFVQSDIDIVYPPDFILTTNKYISMATGSIRILIRYFWLVAPSKSADYLYLWENRGKLCSVNDYGAGIGVIHRESYVLIRGCNEGIVAWGGEDQDLNFRLFKINKEIQSTINVFHQFHPNRIRTQEPLNIQRMEKTRSIANAAPPGTPIIINGPDWGEWKSDYY